MFLRIRYWLAKRAAISAIAAAKAYSGSQPWDPSLQMEYNRHAKQLIANAAKLGKRL